MPRMACLPLQPGVAVHAQAHRLEVFCKAYAHPELTPRCVLANAIARLLQVASDVEALASQGVPAFVDSAAAGHPAMFRNHAAHLGAHMPALCREPVSLEQAYDADLYSNYLRLSNEHDYRADRALQLITQLGGVGATNMGLEMSPPPGGFERLRLLGRLDLSVEAWCLLPRYAPLFTQSRLAIARARLAAAGLRQQP